MIGNWILLSGLRTFYLSLMQKTFKACSTCPNYRWCNVIEHLEPLQSYMTLSVTMNKYITSVSKTMRTVSWKSHPWKAHTNT